MAKQTIPKSLGACADKLFQLREQRLGLEAMADNIKKQETALKDHIIENMAAGDTGASGKTHHVSVYTDDIPQIADADELFTFIKRTGSFDLLQRRLNNAAVKERLDDPKFMKAYKGKVPGVKMFRCKKVSLTKKKGK